MKISDLFNQILQQVGHDAETIVTQHLAAIVQQILANAVQPKDNEAKQ